MKVILVNKFYGYCPGLKRSLKIADELALEAQKDGKKIYFDVPLAHNENVEKSLEKKGFVEVEVNENLDGTSKYFLISAHGASYDKIAKLRDCGFDVRSATCPTVRRVQDLAVVDYKNGYQIVILGKADHAETRGVNGCVDNSAIVFKTVDEAKGYKLTKKTSVLCQTTYAKEEFKKLIKILRSNNKDIEIIERGTYCPIVENRIRGAYQLAKKELPEMIVVVGSKTSSNTKLLAYEIEEIAKVMMVDDESEISKDDFKNVNKVLVVSGTSAPPEIVEAVAKKLESF